MGDENQVNDLLQYLQVGKPLLIVDKGALDEATVKKAEAAGYLVIEKAPGREVFVLR